MKHRAEIEWLAANDWARVGCLRVGGPDFSHACYDEFQRSCTVVLNEKSGVVEVKGWDSPQYGHRMLAVLYRLLHWLGRVNDEGITPGQWEAMETCFLREGINRYCFSRARGKWRNKHLYWHRRRWSGERMTWVKDTDE